METYQDLEDEARDLQKYKDIFYRFRPSRVEGSSDMWIITDSKDWPSASVMYLNADIYRIDECIEMFRKEIGKNK